MRSGSTRTRELNWFFRGGTLRVASSGYSRRIDVDPVLIGRDQSADVHVDDPEVSSLHCEVRGVKEGILVRDLGSANGTLVGAFFVREGIVRTPVTIVVGTTRIELEPDREVSRVDARRLDSFGELYGNTPEMRRICSVLERASPTDLSVLIVGETGTGKEVAARAVHEGSARRTGPLVVIDCGAIAPGLAESALFGHERGAFTDAVAARTGALVEANGGTLFLDEFGELPLDIQPKLLRVLAEREVTPVGGNRAQRIDVRIVAATRRDLLQDMNAQRFRSDLYFRVAQVKVELPPLRRRLSDLPELVRRICRKLGREQDADLTTEWVESRLPNHDWPGNVRELVNVVSTASAFAREPEVADAVLSLERAADDRGTVTAFARAKRAAVGDFERGYFERLLAETKGNVAEMARRSGMERHHVRAFLRKYSLSR